MVQGLSYSNSLFEPLAVISSFNMVEAVWDRYQKFAIPKIQEGTLTIRGSLHYLKELTPKQAQKELVQVDAIIPMYAKLRVMMDEIDEPEFNKFKMAVTELFEAIDLLHEGLQDVAFVDDPYAMSSKVLADDWESQEDAHWDNY